MKRIILSDARFVFRNNCVVLFSRNVLSLVLLVLSLCRCMVVADAQTVVLPTGGDGDEVSYSVGQVVACEAYGSTGSFQAGIQQTYTLTVQSLDEASNIEASVRIYPNPTSSMLRVEMLSNNTAEVRCTLYAESAEVVDSRVMMPSTPMDIDMSNLPNGVYILRLELDGMRNASYQVIKQ